MDIIVVNRIFSFIPKDDDIDVQEMQLDGNKEVWNLDKDNINAIWTFKSRSVAKKIFGKYNGICAALRERNQWCVEVQEESLKRKHVIKSIIIGKNEDNFIRYIVVKEEANKAESMTKYK